MNLEHLSRQIIEVVMNKLNYIAFFLCLASCKESQVDSKKVMDFNIGFEELVLNGKQKGIEHYVKIDIPKEILEYKTIYIGRIENSKNEQLDFIYTTVFSGLYQDSKRANAKIVIYENGNRLGHYYVGGGFKKIALISENEIIVSYCDDNCNQSTRINFRDSIPRKIFIHCRKENGKMFGDLYSFE